MNSLLRKAAKRIGCPDVKTEAEFVAAAMEWLGELDPEVRYGKNEKDQWVFVVLGHKTSAGKFSFAVAGAVLGV